MQRCADGTVIVTIDTRSADLPTLDYLDVPSASMTPNSQPTTPEPVSTPTSTPASTPGTPESTDVIDSLAQITGDDDTQMAVRTEIKYKLIFLVLTVVSSFVVVYAFKDAESAKYKVMASMCVIIFTTFSAHFLYILLKSKQLHQIRVVTTKLKPSFGSIIFATRHEQKKTHAIFSLSELLAIRGSSMHLASMWFLNSLGTIAAMAVALHWLDVHQHAQHANGTNELMELFFGICSSLAGPLVSNFDLNFSSPCHVIMHYVGVVFLGAMPLTYCVQSKFNTASVALWASAWLCLAMWEGCMRLDKGKLRALAAETTCSGDAKDAMSLYKQVHRASLRCILLELAGVFCCAVSFSLYIFNLEEV